MFLHILSFVGVILGFAVAIASLTAGMYYLAELIEEHTVFTKRFLYISSWVIGAIHLLLLFDNLPLYRTIFSLLTLILLSSILETFPNVQITSVNVIISFLFVIVNHFVWFNFFTTHPYYSLKEISSFFGICVWMLPLIYFLSLSANEYTLPSYESSKKRSNLIKSILSYFRSYDKNKV